MSLNCENVMDYVSLYNDGCLSDATANEIEAHLNECPACKKYYKSYKHLEADTSKNFSSSNYFCESEKKYSDLAKRLKFKNLIRDIIFSAAILSSIFITLSVAKCIWKSKK